MILLTFQVNSRPSDWAGPVLDIEREDLVKLCNKGICWCKIPILLKLLKSVQDQSIQTRDGKTGHDFF